MGKARKNTKQYDRPSTAVCHTHTHTSPSPAVNPLPSSHFDSLDSRLTWVSDPHSEELSQHVRDDLIGGGADDRVGSPQQPHLLQHGH